MVLPVTNRERLLSAGLLATLREPFLIAWTLHPEWTGLLAPALDGDMGTALPYGGLLLAQATLDALRELREVRTDLGRLSVLDPHLGDLVTGNAQLPPLPAEPPAFFAFADRQNREGPGVAKNPAHPESAASSSLAGLRAVRCGWAANGR